ncbi:hypothetical protein GCM10027270_02020 [Nocardioides ginkgobilobae]
MSALLSVPLTRRLHRVPVIPLLHGRFAERAWSWDWEDQWTREWWPQGITWAGERLLVSWYAKSGGSRVSVVDLETGRYGHVVLLDPAGSPLKIHAGGLAWIDGWLYVAATAKGFWTLHESDLPVGRAARSASDDRRRDPATWQATAIHRPDSRDDGPPLRWSFLDASGQAAEQAGPAAEEVAQQPSQNPGPTHLYAGEYGRGSNSTRLWRLPVSEGRATGPIELLGTGPEGMQGVTLSNEGLVVSTSHGPWTRGSLRYLAFADEVCAPPTPRISTSGPAASSISDQGWQTRAGHEVMPIGVEDITRDLRGQSWTVAEHPGRRAVVAIACRP